MELKKIILIFFVIFSFSALSAENQIIYTNVTFSANTTAKVLLTPISFISGEVINTNHEIDLGTETCFCSFARSSMESGCYWRKISR